MAKKKDIRIVKKFRSRLSRHFPVKEVIFFGSRARGESKKWSDFDIIVVSDEFANKKSFERGIGFYDFWEEDYPVDFLCYTQEEFNKLKKRISIVREAISTGIIIK